jgi:hypothetical protein
MESNKRDYKKTLFDFDSTNFKMQLDWLVSVPESAKTGVPENPQADSQGGVCSGT